MDTEIFIKEIKLNTEKDKFNLNIKNLIFVDYKGIIGIINDELKSIKFQDYEKNFLTELLLFCTSMGSFLQTTASEFSNGQDFLGKLEGQMIAYPAFRRLLEVCITQGYIFDNNQDIKSRFENYCSEIKGEYAGIQNNKNKKFIGLYEELKNIKYSGLSFLPVPTNKECVIKKSFNVKMDAIVNNKYKNSKIVYPWEELKAYYKILCFYTHGNVNGELLKSIYGNVNFPCVDQIKFYNSLASIYKKNIRNTFQ